MHQLCHAIDIDSSEEAKFYFVFNMIYICRKLLNISTNCSNEILKGFNFQGNVFTKWSSLVTDQVLATLDIKKMVEKYFFSK